jgi:hypothetical protein
VFASCARCLCRRGEVGGLRAREGERDGEQHNYCFLVAIYGISAFLLLSADQSAVFACLMSEFLSPSFVSLIDFRNNFSLLHTSSERVEREEMRDQPS